MGRKGAAGGERGRKKVQVDEVEEEEAEEGTAAAGQVAVRDTL